MIEKVKTGIDGFDELVDGGIPKGYTIFLSGYAGAGKTTFSMQFLDYGAKQGEPGLYITLEENAEQIIRDFEVFDPEINNLVASGKLRVIEIPISDFESFKDTVNNEIVAGGIKRLVIDSISYLQILFTDPLSFRRAIIELSAALKRAGITSILIGEMQSGATSFSVSGVEEFATDGVVVLYYLQKEDTFIRAVRVVKMRGTKIITKLSPYEFIEGKGIVVYPSAQVFAEV
jgi:KaiC/GvpD/RAD55 family RecA-like ATPase